MVKHTTRSASSKALAKAAGEGQAVEAADFSWAMAPRSWGISSASLSMNSRSPTWSRRGTVSKRSSPPSKALMRKSQLLSLTILQIIQYTP